MAKRQVNYLALFLLCQLNIILAEGPSVIIIGAGPSGIAAATKLLENSITNITIIEAENRIGGRIHTVNFENCNVDLGAQYCHGEKNNVVYELVEKLDVLQHSSIATTEFMNFYYSDGSILAPDLAQDIYSNILSYDKHIELDNTISLDEAVFKYYNSTVLKKYSNDSRKLQIAKDAAKFIGSAILVNEGSYTLDRVATTSHFEDSEGDYNLSWKKRGYRTILDVLMKSYPDPSQKLPIDDKIILNKKVTKIIWSGKKPTIKTDDNTSFTADHVIFTPSLGVLKNQINELFEPELPEIKKTAVETLGFDAVMKIVLHFPKKWWRDNDAQFSFIWTEEDLRNIKKEFPEGPSKDGNSWISNILGLVEVNSDYNILIAWVTGEIIPDVETMDEDVMLRGCNYLIKKFLSKNYNITEADKLIRSQWKTNPHFRGSYSYETFGYYKEDVSYHAKLGEPLSNDNGKPIILFAGEATNPIHFSTVHGAIESGIREADRIINLHK